MEAKNNREISIYQDQIAGHNCILQLKENNKNYLLKPFSANEFSFYQKIQQQQFNELQKYLPKFYGFEYIDQSEAKKIGFNKAEKDKIKKSTNSKLYKRKPLSVEPKDLEFSKIINKKAQQQINQRKSLSPNQQTKSKELKKEIFLNILYLSRYEIKEKYMKIENLTQNLKKPCILDIKLGFYYDNPIVKVKNAKLQYQKSIYENSTSKALGFRISGLSKENVFIERYLAIQISNEEELLYCLLAFFNIKNSSATSRILKIVISKLEQLRNLFLSTTSFQFYAASLLILYDQDLQYSQTECDFESKVLLKLIDFGNVIYKENLKENQEIGIKNKEIISAIENVISFVNRIAQNYFKQNLKK